MSGTNTTPPTTERVTLVGVLRGVLEASPSPMSAPEMVEACAACGLDVSVSLVTSAAKALCEADRAERLCERRRSRKVVVWRATGRRGGEVSETGSAE